MILKLFAIAAPTFFLVTAAANAGEVPLYQPAPAWVTKAELKLPDPSETDAPAALILDIQERVENGTLWVYSDGATRITSPEMLSQLATLAVPWIPDKGDLIIHDLKIIRGSEEIDLLASGKTFTVIRREGGLEQRTLDGILTATMPIEGLRLGDILRIRGSVTSKDDALGGNVQNIVPLIAAPTKLGFGRLRVQWPTKMGVTWKTYGTDLAPKPTETGGYSELSMTLPLSKRPDIPFDAPQRFRTPALLEFSTFADWRSVSKVMAPLFKTEGAIREGSELAGELAKIKAVADPLKRTQMALQLVQDQVRYLLVAMDGGNYHPQAPEKTWALRYGDCKAKSLLLVALLRASGIEAEPVLVSSRLGDLVASRLPSALAFDHVIVRAVINGELLWLDGTGLGARIEDIRDTPPFRYALPLRVAGADLMPLPMRKNARPSYDFLVEADESTSVDVSSVIKVTAVLRGNVATSFNLAGGQIDRKKRDEMVEQFFTGYVGEGQYSDISLVNDPASGLTTLSARAVVSSSWRWDDKRTKRPISRALQNIHFDPDRAKANLSEIPVATQPPYGIRYRLVLRLPDGGKGYTLEGEPNVATKVAGFEVVRSVTMANGVVTVDERLDSTGAEIGVSEIPAERDKLATALSRAPQAIAADQAVRRWDLRGKDQNGATQIAAAETIFAKAIANDADDISGYLSRAQLRVEIGNMDGALADFSKAITIEPSAQNYLARADLRHKLSLPKEALADAEAARALDPSSFQANAMLARLRAEAGDLAGAVALLDQRIALGGQDRDKYREDKGDLIGNFGNAQEAITLLDDLIKNKPGNASLLNARCWIKGIRSVMLDTGLKDCTNAIELSSSKAHVLDSRAMIWFRMGRYEEALADLDAVISEQPGLAPSRYLRGIVLAQLNRMNESAADIAIAKQLSANIEAEYARFGIKRPF